MKAAVDHGWKGCFCQTKKWKKSYKFCKSLHSLQIFWPNPANSENYTKPTNSKAALDHGWRGCFCVLPCITNIDHQAPRDLINLSQPKSRWKLEWNSLNISNWFTKYGPKISIFFSKLSQTEQFHGLIIVQLCQNLEDLCTAMKY